MKILLIRGRSHTFKSGGAQAAKITLGLFCPKTFGAKLYIYYSPRQKLGAQAPPAHRKTTPLVVYPDMKHCQKEFPSTLMLGLIP